jgi:hypothetical protein
LLSEHRHVFYFGHGERHALVTPRRLFRQRRVLMTPPMSRPHLAASLSRSRVGPAAASLGQPPARVYWIGSRATSGGATRSAGRRNGRIQSARRWWTASRLCSRGENVGACADAMRSAFGQAHDRYRSEGSTRMPSDRTWIGKACARYWQTQIAVEGDHEATLQGLFPPPTLPWTVSSRLIHAKTHETLE